MDLQRCCEKQKLRKGLWSPDEDEKLLNHITKYGHGCWSSVPKLAGLRRCGKSCRLRWINYLRPDLKRGSFSDDEENLIIELHAVLGNRWSQIAAQIQGRTDNEIKNLWNSSLRKKLRQSGIDPNTHKPLTDAERNRPTASSEESEDADGPETQKPDPSTPSVMAPPPRTSVPSSSSPSTNTAKIIFLDQLADNPTAGCYPSSENDLSPLLWRNHNHEISALSRNGAAFADQWSIDIMSGHLLPPTPPRHSSTDCPYYHPSFWDATATAGTDSSNGGNRNGVTAPSCSDGLFDLQSSAYNPCPGRLDTVLVSNDEKQKWTDDNVLVQSGSFDPATLYSISQYNSQDAGACDAAIMAEACFADVSWPWITPMPQIISCEQLKG